MAISMSEIDTAIPIAVSHLLCQCIWETLLLLIQAIVTAAFCVWKRHWWKLILRQNCKVVGYKTKTTLKRFIELRGPTDLGDKYLWVCHLEQYISHSDMNLISCLCDTGLKEQNITEGWFPADDPASGPMAAVKVRQAGRNTCAPICIGAASSLSCVLTVQDLLFMVS